MLLPQGVLERRIPSKGKLKKHAGAYRAARKAGWGGLWPDWLSRAKPSSAKAATIEHVGDVGHSSSDSGDEAVSNARMPLGRAIRKSASGGSPMSAPGGLSSDGEGARAVSAKFNKHKKQQNKKPK